MRLRRTMRTAMKALVRNPLRAMLTTLGIIIGVTSVIAITEIGQGASAMVQRAVASMGANVLLVFPGSASSAGVAFGAGSANTLTPADADAILRECPSIRSAAPVVRTRAQVVYAGKNWVPGSIYGSTPEFLDVREWPVAEGESFNRVQLQGAARVCLIGQTLARELFEGESPIGKEIRIKNVGFKVLGVLSRKGANMMGMDQDDFILAPWTTIKYRVSGQGFSSGNVSDSSGASSSLNTLSNLYPGGQPSLYPDKSDVQAMDNPMPIRFTNVDQILAAARSSSEIPSAIKEMTELLRERHRLPVEADEDFSVRDMTEMASMMTEQQKILTTLLMAVAAVSLLVGGVGIMNIMLVSVTERTREIGLRMAVGAAGPDILRQFLVESVVLCLLGGALGIACGHGASLIVGSSMKWPVVISPMAIAVAVLVSATVGIVFGFYPAWKASRLDPIEALRYE